MVDRGNSSWDEVLPEETLQTLEAIGEVLLRIRKRMLSEGYDVVDGKVVKKSIIEKND